MASTSFHRQLESPVTVVPMIDLSHRFIDGTISLVWVHAMIRATSCYVDFILSLPFSESRVETFLLKFNTRYEALAELTEVQAIQHYGEDYFEVYDRDPDTRMANEGDSLCSKPLGVLQPALPASPSFYSSAVSESMDDFECGQAHQFGCDVSPWVFTADKQDTTEDASDALPPWLSLDETGECSTTPTSFSPSFSEDIRNKPVMATLLVLPSPEEAKTPSLIHEQPCTRGGSRSHQKRIFTIRELHQSVVASQGPDYLRKRLHIGQQRLDVAYFSIQANFEDLKKLTITEAERRFGPDYDREVVFMKNTARITKGMLQKAQSLYGNHTDAARHLGLTRYKYTSRLKFFKLDHHSASKGSAEQDQPLQGKEDKGSGLVF